MTDYTLDTIFAVSDHLQQQADATVEGWRRLAEAGDPDGIALMAAWLRTEDETDPSEPF